MIIIYVKRKLLACSSLVLLLLGSKFAYADEEWSYGVNVEYTKAYSKWTSAGDNGTSIMHALSKSYTYKDRMPRIANAHIRQNFIMTVLPDGTNKHYALDTDTTAPNGGLGFTRWFDSPYGLVLDFLTSYAPGNSMGTQPDEITISNVPYAMYEYNKVQFPNGSQTVYLAPNRSDLVDAKIATGAMARTGKVIPLVVGDLNGLSYTDSTFSYVDQLKAKTIIMLGGTGIIEATSGLSSNYNVIRVGGTDRLETQQYIESIPNKMYNPSSYQADSNGVVMLGIDNSTVYSELLKLAQTKDVSKLKSAVNHVLNNYNYIGSAPSSGQSPYIVLGVHTDEIETYWICYLYNKAEGRAVYQYVLPSYFPKIYLSKDNSNWTNQDITISASFTMDSKVSIASKKWAAGSHNTSYFANSGNDLSWDNKFTVSSNDTYTVYIKDTYGNETTSKIEITNIDKTAPYASAYTSNANYYGFDIDVTGIGDSQSGVDRVEICAWRDGWDVDGQWYTNKVSSGNTKFRVNTSDFDYKAGGYTVDVRVYDKVGNGSNVIATVYASVPYPAAYSSPIEITNHEYSSGSVYWVKSGDVFTAKSYGYTSPDTSRYKITSQFILARDEWGSGFNRNFKSFLSKIPASYGSYNKAYDFSLYFDTHSTSLNLASGSFAQRTEGSWVDSFFNFTLTGDEAVKLSPLMRIEAENTYFDSAWETNTVIIKSDSGVPSISLTPTPNKTWSNSNVTVSIAVSDARSGVQSWTVRRKLNNGSWINLSDKTASVMLSEDGTHVVEVTATDNVGNSTSKSITVNVDKTNPSISLVSSNTNWTNQNVTITANVLDNTSGVAVKKWASGNQSKAYFASSGTSLGSSFVVTGNNTYTVYAKDTAGNEYIQTIVVGNIDKVNPTITGDFDNAWVKGNKTINFTSTDDLSGINSIKLWNENKTSIIKNGTVSNNQGSLSHTVTTEGITKYQIETTDNALNSINQGVTVRIDNTAPTSNISIPSVTNNRNINVSLTGIVDIHSGVKEIWVSESSSFSSGVTKTPLSGLSSKQLVFNLKAGTNFDNHFSVRTVYFRIYDNVGNYNTYTRTVKLIPLPPAIPVVTLPTEDTLYVKGERILLNWTYDSVDADIGRLPQIQAEIKLTHKGGAANGTDLVYRYTVTGDVFELDLNDLEFGDYEFTVKVFNFMDPEVYSESAPRTFRYNRFKTNGNVFTKNIVTSSPIKYLSISTKYELPKDSKIEGFIYYEKDASGSFNLNKYIKFKLSNDHNIKDMIELPRRVNDIKIEYKLTRSVTDTFTSPILDHIVVLAR